MTAMEERLSYQGYHLVFEDDFDGPELDRTCWNVELHPPGWARMAVCPNLPWIVCGSFKK